MSLLAMCDCGCKQVRDNLDEFKIHGTMHKVYYLPECSEKIEQFLKNRDDMHTSVVMSFNGRLAKLKSDFLRKNPGAKLPDNA